MATIFMDLLLNLYSYFFFFFSDYLTDPSDSDEGEMFTSQATQGYSEGLADNEQESEVSSIFGIDPGVPNIPPNGESSHLSPLEYSAMLKLYRSELENGRTGNGANRYVFTHSPCTMLQKL